MSRLGGGNGDGWPPEGGGQPDGLPGLPPEWGTVVIPDDPAELAEEAATVRRELRRDARRAKWRRRLRLPPRAADDDTQPSLGLPLLIMSIAVVATLTSLFAVAWPGRNSHPILNPRASQDTASNTPASRGIPDLTLADATGAPVRLRESTPAALVLVDKCRCTDLIAATVAAAPDTVVVLVVGRTAPALGTQVGTASAGSASAPAAGVASPPSAGNAPRTPKVRSLADPSEQLRAALGLDPPDELATVVLVSDRGEVIRTVIGATSVDAYSDDLGKLA